MLNYFTWLKTRADVCCWCVGWGCGCWGWGITDIWDPVAAVIWVGAEGKGPEAPLLDETDDNEETEDVEDDEGDDMEEFAGGFGNIWGGCFGLTAAWLTGIVALFVTKK